MPLNPFTSSTQSSTLKFYDQLNSPDPKEAQKGLQGIKHIVKKWVEKSPPPLEDLKSLSLSLEKVSLPTEELEKSLREVKRATHLLLSKSSFPSEEHLKSDSWQTFLKHAPRKDYKEMVTTLNDLGDSNPSLAKKYWESLLNTPHTRALSSILEKASLQEEDLAGLIKGIEGIESEREEIYLIGAPEIYPLLNGILQACPNLTHLDLTKSQKMPTSLFHSLSSLQQLQTLTLNNTTLESEATPFLSTSPLPQLRTLYLRNTAWLTPEIAKNIQEACPKLEEMKLSTLGCELGEAQMSHLSSLPLRSLDLSSTPLHPGALTKLSDFHHLEALDLSFPKNQEQLPLVSLLELPPRSLKTLNLSQWTNLSEEALEKLPKTVTHLKIRDTNIDDLCLLPLYINQHPFQFLDLSGNPLVLGEELLSEASSGGFPYLENVDLSRTGTTDQGLKAFASDKLRTLHLEFHEHLQGEGLQSIAMAPLQSLTIESFDESTPHSLADLAPFKDSLHTLSLPRTLFLEKELLQLPELPQLELLELTGASLSPDALKDGIQKVLGGSPNLKKISLGLLPDWTEKERIEWKTKLAKEFPHCEMEF